MVLLAGIASWLIAVACNDWFRLRVPNRLVLAGGAFLALAAISGQHPSGLGIASAAAGALLVLGLGFPLFCLGWVGAGDVKLLAVLGALFGPGEALALTWALASLLAGLHLAAWWTLRRAAAAGLRLAPGDPGPGHRRRLPHGAHLAAAAMAVLPMTTIAGTVLA